jgi:ADP-ribose pyrophosphatase YjhB (NUDIX family)
MEMNYCRRCGEALTTTDNVAYTCKNSHTLYANPAPTVGIFLIDSDGNVVLSVRGIEPAKGMLDSIGGFIDGDESFEQALEREIREETGLTPDQYTTPAYLVSSPSSYLFDGETRSVLSCFYYAKLNDGVEPKALDDVAELVRVSPADLRPEDMWALDVQVGIRTLLKVIA